MNNKSPVRSAFPPMKAASAAVLSPKALPATLAARQRSPQKPQPAQDEIDIEVTFWLEIVDQPQKHCPAWAYVGNPRETDTFGRRIVAVLNIAHWPAAAAVERQDSRAIRWMVSVAILERLSLQYHPILVAVRFALNQLALAKPKVPDWETVLWSAFQLKDTSFVAGLESAPLEVGTLQQFGALTIQVNAAKLQQWKERKASKKH